MAYQINFDLKLDLKNKVYDILKDFRKFQAEGAPGDGRKILMNYLCTPEFSGDIKGSQYETQYDAALNTYFPINSPHNEFSKYEYRDDHIVFVQSLKQNISLITQYYNSEFMSLILPVMPADSEDFNDLYFTDEQQKLIMQQIVVPSLAKLESNRVAELTQTEDGDNAYQNQVDSILAQDLNGNFSIVIPRRAIKTITDIINDQSLTDAEKITSIRNRLRTEFGVANADQLFLNQNLQFVPFNTLDFADYNTDQFSGVSQVAVDFNDVPAALKRRFANKVRYQLVLNSKGRIHFAVGQALRLKPGTTNQYISFDAANIETDHTGTIAEEGNNIWFVIDENGKSYLVKVNFDLNLNEKKSEIHLFEGKGSDNRHFGDLNIPEISIAMDDLEQLEDQTLEDVYQQALAEQTEVEEPAESGPPQPFPHEQKAPTLHIPVPLALPPEPHTNVTVKTPPDLILKPSTSFHPTTGQERWQKTRQTTTEETVNLPEDRRVKAPPKIKPPKASAPQAEPQATQQEQATRPGQPPAAEVAQRRKQKSAQAPQEQPSLPAKAASSFQRKLVAGLTSGIIFGGIGAPTALEIFRHFT